MQHILTAPFIKELCALTDNLYRMGWDERNGGNISLRLDEAQLKDYLDLSAPIRRLPLAFDASPLAGMIFLVTGTGSYFRHIASHPEQFLGILRIDPEGREAQILWGYEGGGAPTSELPTHLMCHMVRMAQDPAQRVILHTHATNTIAMTFVHALEDRAFTRTLWQMITECLVVFPDGVGVLPWMVCGKTDIGEATADKMTQYRLVIWAHHGILGAGATLDEAFGLVETVEKAAEIYMKIAGLPVLSDIKDQQLWQLADAFDLTPKAGFLNPREG